MIFHFLLLVATQSAQASVCPSVTTSESPSYKALAQRRDQALSRAANSPSLAKPADDMLLKLIKARGPVIQNWIAKRNLKTADEDQLVREWRKYYLMNFHLPQYSKLSKDQKASVTQLYESVKELLETGASKAGIEKQFQRAKKLAAEFVEGLSLSDEIRRQLAQRVSGIKLYWPGNLDSSKYQNKILEFSNWTFAYDPVPNEINVGFEALSYPNEDTVFAVLAHEIGHAIDSCRWVAFLGPGQWPFEKVGNCLRTQESVGAKKRDDSLLDDLVKRSKISQKLARSLRANPTCNKTRYPPTGVQADQLPESFADWFSAEVSARAKLKSRIPRADLCNASETLSTSSYIANSKRLNGIYLVHPVLKKKAGLKSKGSTYCAF